MLKAIHAQESREAAQAKAREVVGKLAAMKLSTAASLVREHIDETLTFYAFPSQQWLKLRTNNPMERLLREARRRTKVVGAFPDGHWALMLVAARLRHVSTTHWGLRRYMNMKWIERMDNEMAYSAVLFVTLNDLVFFSLFGGPRERIGHIAYPTSAVMR